MACFTDHTSQKQITMGAYKLGIILIITMLFRSIKGTQDDFQNMLKLHISQHFDIDEPDADGQTLLWQAADHGYLKSVKDLVKLKCDINKPNKEGKSPLNIAALNENKDIVQYLLKNNAAVDMPDILGRTALYSAAVVGNLDIIKILAEYEANLDIPRDNGATSLYQAAYGGHIDVVRYLLDKSPALIDKSKDSGATPFYIAAFSGKLDILQLLQSKGADIYKAKTNGISPLMIACDKGHLEVVIYLIEQGTDVNATRDNGITAIYTAAIRGHLEIVHSLIKAGADINAVTNEGQSPVYAACSVNNEKVLSILINNKADVNLDRSNGFGPLHYACQADNFNIASMLLKAGAKFDVYTLENESPFMIAAEFGSLVIVKYLYEHFSATIDLNELNINGESALYKAASVEHSNVVEYLLVNNAALDAGKAFKLYPLIAAVKHLHVEIISLIFKLIPSCDCLVIDFYGYTPLHHALANGHEECIYILLNQSDCYSEVSSSSGLAPIHIASSMNLVDVLHVLLGNGANVNSRDNHGETASFKASIQGHINVIKLLLKFEADVNLITYSDQSSALCVAVLFGHTQIVQLLISNGANIDHMDSDNETPLFHAAQYNFHGESGIISASYNDYAILSDKEKDEYLAILKILLVSGANKSIKRLDGKTATRIALLTGNSDGYKMLSESKGTESNIIYESEDVENRDESHKIDGEDTIDASTWNYNVIILLVFSFILVALSPMIAFKISCMLDDKEMNATPSKATQKRSNLNKNIDLYKNVNILQNKSDEQTELKNDSSTPKVQFPEKRQNDENSEVTTRDNGYDLLKINKIKPTGDVDNTLTLQLPAPHNEGCVQAIHKIENQTVQTTNQNNNITSLTVNMVNVYNMKPNGSELIDPQMSPEDMELYHNGSNPIEIEGISLSQYHFQYLLANYIFLM